jgi:hypothetical protein
VFLYGVCQSRTLFADLQATYAHMPADSPRSRWSTVDFKWARRPRMSLPSVEMGSLFLAARLARVIATTYHRFCCRGARTVSLVLACQFWTSDHDLRSGGPCPWSAHSRCSSSDVIEFAVQCAECRVQERTRIHQPNQCAAVVWARGVAASQHGGGALAVGDED